MKILFIEPSIGKQEITTFAYPPLGLLALAAYVREKGHKPYIYDTNHDNRKLLEVLWDTRPDIVGISCMSLTMNEGLMIAQEIKKTNKNIKTVLGGIHPTIAPEDATKVYVDYIVQGEGEKAMDDIINNFMELSPYSLIKNLDDLPIPAYDLLNWNNYRSPYASRFPWACMVRSRGCIFKCTFCGNAKMFGNTFRCQSPQRTIEEIDQLLKITKAREISFKDTELTLDKRLPELMELIIRKKYPIIWSCNGRASNVDEKLLKLMKLAGCRSITYGVESGDEEILKYLKKPITLDAVRNAVRLTKKVGIQTILNFMIGNPYDTKETIEKTINFAIELNPDYVYFGYTTPFPGTELREQAIKNNWLVDYKLESIRYDEPIMNATNLSIKELKTYLKIAYKRFYIRLSYIFKQIKNLKFGKIKNYWEGLWKILS